MKKSKLNVLLSNLKENAEELETTLKEVGILREANNKLKECNDKLKKAYKLTKDERDKLKKAYESSREANNRLKEKHQRDIDFYEKQHNKDMIKIASLSKFNIIASNEEIFKIMVTEYRNERNDKKRRNKMVSKLMYITTDNDWNILKGSVTAFVDTNGLCALFTEEQCEVIKRAMGRI